MSAGWHPIALSQDVPAGVAAPVLLAGRELVLWRTGEGLLRLFVDRCPHRGMRLSFGFVRGDALVCLYHGWRWGADGACRAIPAHPDLRPPRSIAVAGFPVREAAGLVWGALAEPEGPPPETPDAARPLATLAVERPAGDLAKTLGEGPLVRAEADGIALLLGLQPVDDDRAALHAFAADPADAPLRALAAAEALRARLEREGDTP